ncbi:MAG: type II toxin-antitoxin system Phd/YefM family antitoxin [Candidatus Binataceae bacterium]
MKIIPLSEAKAKLSRCGRLCHNGPVVITVNGKPSFQLVPLAEDDNLIDQLLLILQVFVRCSKSG